MEAAVDAADSAAALRGVGGRGGMDAAQTEAGRLGRNPHPTTPHIGRRGGHWSRQLMRK